MAHEFVTMFGLENSISNDYFFNLANAELAEARYAEAAICIVNSRLFDRFNCLELCVNLVDINRVHECKQILDQVEPLRVPVIRALSNPKYFKTATKLVLDFEMDPENFGQLLTILDKNSAVFFIRRVFKAKDHADHMPCFKVEDLLVGHPRMTNFYMEELCKHAEKQKDETNRKLWYNRAKGVWIRNDLQNYPIISKQVYRDAMEIFVYDPTLETDEEDRFGPVMPNTLSLPADIQVHFIDEENACDRLLDLLGKPVIGLDAEWRPNLTKFNKTKSAILQISDESAAYLIDLIALEGS